MVNEKIVQIFTEIADMLEILGENPFRIRAHQRAAEVIRGIQEDLGVLHQRADKAIEEIPGIGKDLHQKIIEIIETGRSSMHEKLVRKLSPGILDLLRVRGIGPKKVKLFHDQLDIDSIDKLRSAAESGALAVLPGMGEKSQKKILDALQQMAFKKERIPFKLALKEAEAYVAYMKKCKAVKQIQYAGSLRRKMKTIGDIDILTSGSDAASISQHFFFFFKIVSVQGSGETKSSVLLGKNIQVDLRVVAEESFGAALFYFTGPKHFNIYVRTLALKKGLKVNEYGLFKGERKIAGKTEEEMFKALHMAYLTPVQREDFQ